MYRIIKIGYTNKDENEEYDEDDFIFLDTNINIEDIPKDVIFLRIKGKNITSFDCNLFPNLEILYLSYNSLNNFIPSATLKKVSLKFNYLKDLDLTNAENLETLDISYNNLTNITLNANLKKLYMENFYENEWFMDDEQEFIYRHNYSRLNKLICNEKLEVLIITNLYLEDIFFNDNIKVLVIGNNFLLKNNFKFLTNLKILEIHDKFKKNYIIPENLDIYYNDKINHNRKILSRRKIYLLQEIKESAICPLCKKNINLNYKLNSRYLNNKKSGIFFSCC